MKWIPRRAPAAGLLLVASVSMAACGVAGGRRAGHPPWPRPQLVVFILVDALRAGHLGCYGSSSALTPSIDDLAAGSFVFEQTQATSAWTRSSIASLFTSRYPVSHGVLGRRDALAPAALTLAEVLSARGWETLGISTNGNAGELFGFAQGFETFTYPGHWTSGKARAEGVTELALQVVVQRRDQIARRPLFLFLHYLDPHEPYLANPGLLPAREPAGRFSGSREDLERLDGLPAGERTPEDEARIRHLYAGEVRFCDHWIGRLLAGLKGLNVFERALIVLTADHGEGLWDHGERSHGRDLYQEQIHVPLMVRFPGMRPRGGRRIRDEISTVDVAPTVLGAAGIEIPSEFQGHDLGALTRGTGRPPAPRAVYSELQLDRRRLEAIRRGRFKLIRAATAARPGEELELFDLETDATERVNLVQRLPERTAELELALGRWHEAAAQAAAVAAPVDPETLPEEVREALRALGYEE